MTTFVEINELGQSQHLTQQVFKCVQNDDQQLSVDTVEIGLPKLPIPVPT